MCIRDSQKPMIEQCCEIVRKFNAVYGDTLTEPEIVLPQNAACLRLPGTDGKAKMSKSLGNCIYLSEEPEDIKKKVMSMYTDPNHLRVQDRQRPVHSSRWQTRSRRRAEYRCTGAGSRGGHALQ